MILARKRRKKDRNISFERASDQWMSVHNTTLSVGSRSRYIALLERINAKFGNTCLSQLSAEHIRDFYKNLATEGANKKTGKALSTRSILHHHKLICAILSKAHNEGLIAKNPASQVASPRPEPKEPSYLDETEVIRLCQALADAPPKWRAALTLLLYTGLRRGELAGLEWGDVSFTRQTITIRRTIQYLSGESFAHTDADGIQRKGQNIEKPPKTKNSRRVIAICDTMAALLQDYRQWWLNEQAAKGGHWLTTQKLFTKDNGTTINPDSITCYTKRFAKKHGLPPITPHSLRHTNISLMIAAGVDIKTVSTRAGHASVTTTLNTYTHQIQSKNAQAAQKLANILTPPPDELEVRS